MIGFDDKDVDYAMRDMSQESIREIMYEKDRLISVQERDISSLKREINSLKQQLKSSENEKK